MKILHTSDWHLGHTLYNYDRTEEQQDMLKQMVDIVVEQKPDVFLLCGDVYHTSQPSASVQTMLANALVRIHDAHPQMAIIMTAGNHDSGSKHEIFRIPWQALKVYAIGQIEKEDFDKHIIFIPGKGYVIAIPYAYERNIPEGFFKQLLDRVAQLNTEGLPVVMTAHTTAKGCDFTGHDQATDLTVGGIDSFEVEKFGEGFDYLALGHIHREQFVHTGHHNVRYCGTPLPVSFDEQFPHSVSIVEIGKHGDTPQVEKIEIVNPKPLVTLPTEGLATWEDVKELLSKYPNDIPAYICLNVQIEDFLPAEAFAEAASLTVGKQCRLCHINTKRQSVSRSETRVMTVQEFQEVDPIEIAIRYAESQGITFDDDMEKMFKEVMRMVNDDERNDK